MSPLQLLFSAARRVPKSVQLEHHGYLEVSDKIKLSLILRHQAIFTSTDVTQVNITTATGDMGILANHIPSIEVLQPGVVEVIESRNVSKWFVSGGSTTVCPNNKLTINAVEAAPLEAFSIEAIWVSLAKAQRIIARNGTEGQKAEALQHAVATK